MKPVSLCGDHPSSYIGKFRYRIKNKEHYQVTESTSHGGFSTATIKIDIPRNSNGR